MLSPVPDAPLEARRFPGSFEHQTRQVGEPVPSSLSPAAWLEQKAVDSLVQLVRSLPDFEQMVANLVQTVTALFNAEKAGVMLWDSESQELVLQKPAFGVNNPEIIDQYRVRLSHGGNAIRVFTTGQPYLSNDCPRDPKIIQKYVDLFGSRKVMTVPLRVDGQIIGVLHVTNKRQGDFTEQELHLLEKVADHLATLIDNARLFRVIRRSEQEADTLYHLSLKLVSLLNLEDIPSLALPTAVTLLDADVAGAHLNSAISRVYDREMGQYVPDIMSPVSFWEEMLPGQQAARLSLVEGHFHESQGSWQAILSAHGLLEILLVPLVGDEIVGSLFVARRHRLPFTKADEKLLARLALVIGSAIRNAELKRRTERALTELRCSLESIARLRDIQEKLTVLVLRGERLPSLTAAIAVLVDNPVLLEDRYGTVLSCATPVGWVGPEPVTLAQLAQRNRDAARLIGELFQLDHHTRLLTVPGEDRLRLVAPVIVGNETLAVLSVPQVFRVLGDLDVLAVQSAATVVALVLMRERAILETERRLQGDLLRDILAGKFESEEDLARRARYLGYDLLHPHVLLMVSIDDFEHLVKLGEREEMLQRIKQNIYDLVRASLAPRTPRWLIWASGTQVVALVAVNPDGLNPIFEAARRLHSRAERELPGASILVGVSQTCRSMPEVPAAYAEVKRFLKFGRAMQWQGGLIFVERLGLYRILLQYEELGPELIRFASDRLSRLQTYDQEHGGDLIACLRAYLTGGGEIKTTAEALRLHRNSVRYKLQRIEEIARVDLNDAETRFQIQLALKIVDLQSAIKLSALN
jgi:PucR family transcriptional regulator, purine catabolism regulatory protein